MHYKFTNLSTWPVGYLGVLQKTSSLNDASCSPESYFLDFENDNVHKKKSHFRLTPVKTVWKKSRRHFCFLMLYTAPLFIKIPIRNWFFFFFQTDSTNINLNSDVFLRILLFSCSRSQENTIYKNTLYRSNLTFFWSPPRYPGWSCWKVRKFVIYGHKVLKHPT